MWRTACGSASAAARRRRISSRLLGERVAEGLDVDRRADLASGRRDSREEVGIPLTTLDETPELDLDVDGADEIGPGLALIKGGGGALLREKIVANASRADDRHRRCRQAGRRSSAPFRCRSRWSAFGLTATALAIERAAIELGLSAAIDLRRHGGEPFVTDGGNRILDASFGRIPDPEALAGRLAEIPGVVEHGLFLGFADLALVASPDGVAEIEA